MAELLETIQEVATLVATASGIWIAYSGLDAWKTETLGRRDIDLCQTVIEKFYEAEHKLQVLRSPLSFAHEGAARATSTAESEEDKRRRDLLFVPLARFNEQYEFWSEFLSFRFRMRALFGDEAAECFEHFDEELRSFRAAAQARYRALYNSMDATDVTDFEKTIWEVDPSKDPISLKVKDTIRAMETICVPIVRNKQVSFTTRVRRKINSVWRRLLD